MAYSGSTAGTTSANPPRKIVEPMVGLQGTTGYTTAPSVPNGQGGAVWAYVSTNLTTDLTNGTFFTDGQDLGMRPGDIVIGSQFSSAGSSVTTFIGSVTGVSTAGAALSTASLMTSTFA